MRVWVINEQYGELYWILETKGRVWEGMAPQNNAIMQWCERISEQTGKIWQFSRINQVDFETIEPKTLMELVRGFESRKGKLFS